ncbi:ABC transporter ATP-binding protein [Ilumatobacter nonamiensis]|uniref:ABC transporter ATP-binding protein n=1 Tax=Ilumatobacter nonamiensis TaxID=467093 RepID=UPI0009FEB076|nr:ABC transporter ATP-binding protein [Ilumatobacter nonamiensis]
MSARQLAPLPPLARTRIRASSDAVITVDAVSKSYAARPVVDDVSFSVYRGEIFGLLGANGAGKTTVVECVQGLRRPDTGTLRVLGLDPIADRARLRRAIGSQLQESSLPDRLRAGEAVALFDRSHGRDALAHLDRWGLAEQATTSFADLSGGQRQRLFVVLALLNEPQVVFLDELTQGLDPAARRGVWQVIRAVRDAGATVVLVSHFAEEIETLCDRVAVMDHGRIVDSGSPREITDRHASLSTVSFSAPRAFDRRRLTRIHGVDRVEQEAGRITVFGTSPMIAPVCAATLDGESGPDDLHIQHPTLDDALVNMIGTNR